jgi:hypothetical protein
MEPCRSAGDYPHRIAVDRKALVTIEELAAKIAELEQRLAILEDLAGRDNPKPAQLDDEQS